MAIQILHTNDFHGKLDEARMTRLRVLRSDADVYLDNGDAIKTGNLGIPMRQEPVWARLDELRCTASVLGNRETHILESAFRAKMTGAVHPVLCANLRRRDGSRPLPGHLLIEAAGLRVGVVGVMVPMVTERMRTQAASAFLWDDPIATAISVGESLREKVDLLIALTHIGIQQDERLATRTSAFDLILGGHSHTVLEQPRVVGGTPILQAGSHGRFAGVYTWSPGSLEARLVSLA